MSFAPTALTALGTGLGAFGQYSQSMAEKKAYDIEAGEVEAAGKIEQYQMGEREESLRSTQTALYAKAGVKLSGSPLEVMLHSATEAEFDKMIAQYNTELKAQQLRYAGALAANEGEFKMGMTLLGGALKFADYVGKVPTTPKGTEDELG